MSRREFSRSVKVAIIKRATRVNGDLSGQFCERCGMPCKGRFEIHHLIEDALEIDKGRPLTAEDGSLWCVPCHKEHTASVSAPAIAKAKRREAAYLGAKAAPRTAIPQRPRPTKPPPKAPVPGLPRLAREGFVSIGDASSAVLARITSRKDAAE